MAAKTKSGKRPRASAKHWTFLTSHGHVLLCLARDPELRLRDIASQVGRTERAVQGIISDLVAGGYVTRVRAGRRNRYQLHPQRPLRLPLEGDQSLAELLVLAGKTRLLDVKPTRTKKRSGTKRARPGTTQK